MKSCVDRIGEGIKKSTSIGTSVDVSLVFHTSWRVRKSFVFFKIMEKHEINVSRTEITGKIIMCERYEVKDYSLYKSFLEEHYKSSNNAIFSICSQY